MKRHSTPYTYQVYEKTNIQEKSLLQAQPLLNEFKRITLEFTSKSTDPDHISTYEQKACFTTNDQI